MEKISIYIKIDNYKININEIEVFSLYTFKQLIIEKFQKKKDFFIAKVSSIKEDNINNKELNKLFNSYYCANQINKYLFKYESERRLLHRMHVKNPVNNIYILEKVEYFRIKYNKKLLKQLINFKNQTNSSININISKETINKNTNLIIKSTFFATDDDFLCKENIRKTFKLNCEEEEEFLYKLSRENNGIIELLQTINSSDENPFQIRVNSFIHIHILMIFVLSVILLLVLNFKECRILISVLLSMFIISFFLFFIYIFCLRKETFRSINAHSNVEI